jgi:tetratricopeptide (TPR) repeat protein
MHFTISALSNETNDAQSCLKHNILYLALRKAEAAKKNKPKLRLAFAYNQISIAYMIIGKFTLATEYFKQCIEMLKRLNANVDKFSFPIYNLGLTY